MVCFGMPLDSLFGGTLCKPLSFVFYWDQCCLMIQDHVFFYPGWEQLLVAFQCNGSGVRIDQNSVEQGGFQDSKQEPFQCVGSCPPQDQE